MNRRTKEIQMLRLESERIKQELHKQKQELDRRKNEMLRKAREQADEIYRSSRRESEAILKELRSMKADFDAKKLEAAAEAARKQLNKQFSEDAPLLEGTPLSKRNCQSRADCLFYLHCVKMVRLLLLTAAM